EVDGCDILPKMHARGWEAFARLAPAEIADAIAAIHRDPGGLATELRRTGQTLVHGDLNYRNVALGPDRVVLLDWALACSGPSEVDAAWLLTNQFMVQATREEMIEDWQRVAGDDFDPRAFEVALIGELAMDGQWYGGWIDGHPDPMIRAW